MRRFQSLSHRKHALSRPRTLYVQVQADLSLPHLNHGTNKSHASVHACSALETDVWSSNGLTHPDIRLIHTKQQQRQAQVHAAKNMLAMLAHATRGRLKVFTIARHCTGPCHELRCTRVESSLRCQAACLAPCNAFMEDRRTQAASRPLYRHTLHRAPGCCFARLVRIMARHHGAHDVQHPWYAPWPTASIATVRMTATWYSSVKTTNAEETRNQKYRSCSRYTTKRPLWKRVCVPSRHTSAIKACRTTGV